MNLIFIVTFALCACWSAHATFSKPVKFESTYKWKTLQFDYSCDKQKKADIKSGFYKPYIPFPLDADVDIKTSRTFVTIPRIKVGSPATLGYVDENNCIKPYPSWHYHRVPTWCRSKRLISVSRIKIEKCGRLWVLDSGVYGGRMICEPQLLAFNLTNDKLIHKIKFDDSLVDSISNLATPVVDIRGSCDDTFIYMADSTANVILVHDLKNSKTWKVSHSSMYPSPQCSKFENKEYKLDVMLGISSMALEPYTAGADRTLFYNSVSSTTQSSVQTSYLRNQSLFANGPRSAPDIFKTYDQPRSSQSSTMDIDSNGISYFNLVKKSSLNCWNTKSRDYGSYIREVYQNPAVITFPTSVKISKNLAGEAYLYAVTSNLQMFVNEELNSEDVNFRISRVRMEDIDKECKNQHEINLLFNYAQCQSCS